MGQVAVIPTVPVVPQFTMNDMERVALAIAKGGMFGSSDPNAVLTLCMLAQAEGQHPAVVFRDYHIISGKPAKKADAMLRDFIVGGGKVEWHQLDDECADATFSHPAGGSVRITWDKARVLQAQLGGNAMHKKYPRQMLRSRVVSEGVRTVFPGATSGLYVPEEVAAFDDAPADPIVAAVNQPHASPPKPDWPDGPCKGISALKTASRTLWREISSAPDVDSFDALLVSEKPMLQQIRLGWHEGWNGDGADFEGFGPLIARKRAELLEEAEAGDAEPVAGDNGNTILDAG